MNLRLMSLTLLLAAITALGCASSKKVRVEVQEPGELSFRRTTIVAVMYFEGEGGYAVTERVQSKLFDGGHFRLVDRRHMSSRDDEIRLAFTGKVDPSTAQKFGNELNAELLVFGMVDAYVVVDEKSKGQVMIAVHKKTGKEASLIMAALKSDEYAIREVTRPMLIRDGRVAVTFKLVDVESGEIMAQRTVDRIFKDEKFADEDGNFDMPSKDFILDQLVSEVADEFVRMVSPHMAICTLEWAKVSGSSQEGKLAEDFFCRGLYARSARTLEGMLIGATDGKQKGMIQYDLGLCYEAMGNLTKAESCYNRALDTYVENMVVDALARIESRESAERKLQEQLTN